MNIANIAIGLLMATILQMSNPRVVHAAEVLIGLGPSASQTALYTINTQTAATTLLNTIPYVSCVGMAYDPITQKLYAVCRPLTGETSDVVLVQIDPTTGSAIQGVKINIQRLQARVEEEFPDVFLNGFFEITGIAFDTDGVLYGYFSGPSFGGPPFEEPITYVYAVATINLANGDPDLPNDNFIYTREAGGTSDVIASFKAKTLIVATNTNTTGYCSFNRLSCLETIDLSTGARGQLSSPGGFPSITAMSLHGGTLFVSLLAPSELDTLDPVTGQLTPIGPIAPIEGLASVPAPRPDVVRKTLDESEVAFTADPSSEQTTIGSKKSLGPLVVGDPDNFGQPGELEDELSPENNNQSPHVQDILGFFVPENGFQGAVNLDEPALNQAVGFTHFVTVPPQSQVTDATVSFAIKGTGDNVANDTILYNDSVFDNNPPPGALPGFAPFIALQDLLGRAPRPNHIEFPKIDLSRVPVRLHNTGTISGPPDEFRDLRPLLTRDGRFDMVVSDDTAVDGSILRATVAKPIVGVCPPESGSVALFSFTATLQNLMPNPLDDIKIVVDSSTSSGVLLRLPNGEVIPPTGEASLADLTPAHIDSLQIGQSVTVPFNLCIASLAPFDFFVDVTALVPGP